MTKLLLLITAALFVFLQVGCVTDQRAQQEAREKKKPNYDQRKILTDTELIAKAKHEGQVRVIVKLKMQFTPEARLEDPKKILAQRAEIARLQLALMQSLSPYKPSRVKRFKYVPGLALTLDSRAIEALLKLVDLVTSVELDDLRHLHLVDTRPLVGASQAQQLGYMGGGQTIAILDTGVDKSHGDLVNKVISEACFSENLCPNGTNEEYGTGTGTHCSTAIPSCDHGTHVAGIAGGWNGIARQSFLVAVKVFDRIDDDAVCASSNQSAPCLLTSDSNYLMAMDWLYGHTYNVLGVPMSTPVFSLAALNLSFGGGAFTSSALCDQSLVKDSIDNLRWIGVATVVSAGNDSLADAISFPACISSAISVGATTKSDGIASYSNRSASMSLWAPGSQIQSAVPSGGLARKSGTSMAAPHVAGAFAIVKGSAPYPLEFGIADDVLSALQGTGRAITGSPSASATRIRIDQAIGTLGQ